MVLYSQCEMHESKYECQAFRADDSVEMRAERNEMSSSLPSVESSHGGLDVLVRAAAYRCL